MLEDGDNGDDDEDNGNDIFYMLFLVESSFALIITGEWLCLEFLEGTCLARSAWFPS